VFLDSNNISINISWNCSTWVRW